MVKAAGLNVDAEGPGQVEVSLQHPGVKMLVNALGPPPPDVVEHAHDHGLLVGALVGAKAHAERQVAIGVDVLVAQGTEAGGHCGEISTMVLVPEVVDAVGPDVPVLAAGGIATRSPDGRRARARRAGRVDRVDLAHRRREQHRARSVMEQPARGDVARHRALACDDRASPPASCAPGGPRRGSDPDAPDPLPMPLQGILHHEAARRFVPRADSQELSGFPVGQIVGRMNEVRPTKDVIFDMVEEWIETTERLARIADVD